ncbi:chorismate--pyruvate lyase family protein [Ferrovum myxofaciens]|uniref:chorismate--pyruvate lyase family protein n=1 Tax=Ferrovum myxofaciens TaxID=416213 RepID=UPI000A02EE9C|nr:chorismate lyase [Ferrovum myxofaciens]MBW8029034.1 chorismate lyase [Ferrovum sp.]NDU90691.1 chorismate lyase [Ferrovum sp.]
MIPPNSPVWPRDTWTARPLRSNLSQAHRNWLTTPDSLTSALKTVCPRFQVKILETGTRFPFPDEARLLKISCHQQVWSREVLLCNGALPLVFARSILSLRDLPRAWPTLDARDPRPLGEFLFTDARIRRTPLHFQKLSLNHPLRVRLDRFPLDLPPWARRSLHVRQGSALLVTEIFLTLPPHRSDPAQALSFFA